MFMRIMRLLRILYEYLCKGILASSVDGDIEFDILLCLLFIAVTAVMRLFEVEYRKRTRLIPLSPAEPVIFAVGIELFHRA